MSSNFIGSAKRTAKQEGDLIEHMKVSAAGGVEATATVAAAAGPTSAVGVKGCYQSTQHNARQPPISGANFSPLMGGGGGGADKQYGYDQQSTENLRRALRISESTNTSGYATIHSLGRQREIMQNTLESVGTTRENLLESQSVIRSIRMGIYKEWFVKACVILSLCGLIVLIIWVKFMRK